MRLIGAPNLSTLRPKMVDVRALLIIAIIRHTCVYGRPEMVDARALDMHTTALLPPPNPYAPCKDDLTEITRQIAALQTKLDAIVPQSTPSSSPVSDEKHWSSALSELGKVMAGSILKTVVSTSEAGSLHRSGLFLVVFLVVHMAGT